MGDCITKVQQITFDVNDEQVTKVTIKIDFSGDCGILVKRIYEKTFPARFSVVDLMTMDGGVKDYLLWI